MIGINEIASFMVIMFIIFLVCLFLLNSIKNHINEKIKVIDNQLDGLRHYLYEIDPQFDHEREVTFEYKKTRDNNLDVAELILKKQELEDLIKIKKVRGQRTLYTKFDKPDNVIDIDV